MTIGEDSAEWGTDVPSTEVMSEKVTRSTIRCESAFQSELRTGMEQDGATGGVPRWSSS